MKPIRLAVAAATLLIVACAKEAPKADSTAAAPPPPAPKTITLAELAGTWNMRSVPTTGDTTATTYTLAASADTTWMITFASGLKVPVHVTASGDSILLKTGIYTSQRRKGVKVWTEGSSRLEGGKLIGTTTGHYQGVKDSVLHLRTEGTKAP